MSEGLDFAWVYPLLGPLVLLLGRMWTIFISRKTFPLVMWTIKYVCWKLTCVVGCFWTKYLEEPLSYLWCLPLTPSGVRWAPQLPAAHREHAGKGNGYHDCHASDTFWNWKRFLWKVSRPCPIGSSCQRGICNLPFSLPGCRSRECQQPRACFFSLPWRYVVFLHQKTQIFFIFLTEKSFGRWLRWRRGLFSVS